MPVTDRRMPANRKPIGLAAACLLAGALSAAGAAAGQPALDALAASAAAEDWDAARPALAELARRGQPARRALVAAVRQWLARDADAIRKAAAVVSDLDAVRQAEGDLALRRRQAVTNLAGMRSAQQLRQAYAHYHELGKTLAALRPVYDARSRILDPVRRRPELLAVAERAGSPDAPVSEQAERDLMADAAHALDMPLKAALAIPDFGDGRGPTDRRRQPLWLHRACRLIERYNESLYPLLNQPERDNVALVNDYRERLGFLHCELDPRLIQSARRHSKEMTDLRFFGHFSPNPVNRTFIQRIENAGYFKGYSENCLTGAYDGLTAFRMWLASPGHHRGMVTQFCTTIGVGMWRGRWTQHFGYGTRMMIASDAARAELAIRGPVLPPEDHSAAARKQRTAARLKPKPSQDKSKK